MRFLLYTDYAGEPKIKYELLHAKTLEAAIDEANAKRAADPGSIYLSRIMCKTFNTYSKHYGKIEHYTAVLCKRVSDWHSNTEDQNEGEHLVKRWTRDDTYENETKFF